MRSSKVSAGPFTIRGDSVGGVYTALEVAELGVLLDVGLAPRSFVGRDHLFLSHGHADHLGALFTHLGIRGLLDKPKRLKLYLPAEIAPHVRDALQAMEKMQRYPLEVDLVPLEPGGTTQVKPDLWVQAFRTFHPVPSLGYQFFREVSKLKEDYRDLPGAEIGRRRKAGEDLFYTKRHLELAYATDTLVSVLDQNPELYQSKVLVLECTFLDERKSLEAARAGCHIHLDEILERASLFQNEYLVLMHFSQLYRPEEVPEILRERLPEDLAARTLPFVPKGSYWPG